MPPRSYTIRPPSNPILQALYLLLGGILLVGAVILGAFVLAFVLAFAVIAVLVFYARVWWLSRRIAGRGGSSGTGRGSGPARSGLLEAEYTVVSERDEKGD